MKIYIAGPITGVKDYKENFRYAEILLTAKGHKVWNPAHHPGGFEHHEYMSVCLPAVHFCDAVFMLPGWEKSVGATQEFDYAVKQNKRIFMKTNEVDWQTGAEQDA